MRIISCAGDDASLTPCATHSFYPEQTGKFLPSSYIALLVRDEASHRRSVCGLIDTRDLNAMTHNVFLHLSRHMRLSAELLMQMSIEPRTCM